VQQDYNRHGRSAMRSGSNTRATQARSTLLPGKAGSDGLVTEVMKDVKVGVSAGRLFHCRN